MSEKIIRIPDVRSGYDESISDFVKIIDTPHFQRLRDIRQLDLIDKVFPGAKHSRFEHSIGVLHHEREIIRNLEEFGRYEFDETEKATSKLAALIHDLAHPPFSHATEYVLTAYGEPNHDEKVLEILENMKEEITQVKDADFGLLIDIFKRRHPLARTIWGSPIGSDTLDYVNRDANRCGVSVDSDVDRIETHVAFDGQTYGTSTIVEEVLKKHIGSYIFMYLEVYNRKACALWKGILRRGVYEALENGRLTPESIWLMNDIDLLTSLKESGGVAKEARRRIDYRIKSAAFLTIKAEGYEEYEDKANKPIETFGTSERKLMEIANYFKDINKTIEFERDVEKILNLDAGTVTIAEMPHIEMLRPEDVPIFSRSDGWTSLFKRNRDWEEIFYSDIRKKYAVRIGVVEKFRKRAYEQARQVYDAIISLV